jgi:rhodanese-related sulfurtransferase
MSIASCSASSVALAEAQIGLADEISVDEAYELYQDGVYFLDVRTPQEWDEFHAPNTTLIPLDELEYRLTELPEGEPIVVVCRSGNRSQVGRDILRANGFEETTSVAGGLREWMESGYPVE